MVPTATMMLKKKSIRLLTYPRVLTSSTAVKSVAPLRISPVIIDQSQYVLTTYRAKLYQASKPRLDHEKLKRLPNMHIYLKFFYKILHDTVFFMEVDNISTKLKYDVTYYSILKKNCDNCSKELVKFSFFSPDKKIYRYNNAILCADCFKKISAHEQLEDV